MYKSVNAVAESMRRRWGIEMDIFQIASNCKEILIDQRMVPLVKKLELYDVVDYTAKLGSSVYKVLNVFYTQELGTYDTGSLIITDDIIFPPQTVWVSQDNNINDLTVDELTELQAIPYIRGPYADYSYEPPHLRFNQTDMKVGVLFSGIAVDESGYILIPEEMVVALADYCAEIYIKPQFLLGKVQAGIYDRIQQEVERGFANARTGTMMRNLSQNEIDKALNIMSSMDRNHVNITR